MFRFNLIVTPSSAPGLTSPASSAADAEDEGGAVARAFADEGNDEAHAGADEKEEKAKEKTERAHREASFDTLCSAR